MKKIVTLLIFGLMSLASCTEYDEVAMWNKNEDMGSRLAALERLCDRMNTNIASLQRIVEALQANDYVTGVAPVVGTSGGMMTSPVEGSSSPHKIRKKVDFPAPFAPIIP